MQRVLQHLWVLALLLARDFKPRICTTVALLRLEPWNGKMNQCNAIINILRYRSSLYLKKILIWNRKRFGKKITRNIFFTIINHSVSNFLVSRCARALNPLPPPPSHVWLILTWARTHKTFNLALFTLLLYAEQKWANKRLQVLIIINCNN